MVSQGDEGRAVIRHALAIALRDHLTHENGVGVKSKRARREAGAFFDLGAKGVGLEALVALEPLVPRVALVVQNRIDADRMRVRAGARLRPR